MLSANAGFEVLNELTTSLRVGDLAGVTLFRRGDVSAVECSALFSHLRVGRDENNAVHAPCDAKSDRVHRSDAPCGAVQMATLVGRHTSQWSAVSRQRGALTHAATIGPEAMGYLAPLKAPGVPRRRDALLKSPDIRHRIAIVFFFVTHAHGPALTLIEYVAPFGRRQSEQLGALSNVDVRHAKRFLCDFVTTPHVVEEPNKRAMLTPETTERCDGAARAGSLGAAGRVVGAAYLAVVTRLGVEINDGLAPRSIFKVSDNPFLIDVIMGAGETCCIVAVLPVVKGRFRRATFSRVRAATDSGPSPADPPLRRRARVFRRHCRRCPGDPRAQLGRGDQQLQCGPGAEDLARVDPGRHPNGPASSRRQCRRSERQRTGRFIDRIDGVASKQEHSGERRATAMTYYCAARKFAVTRSRSAGDILHLDASAEALLCSVRGNFEGLADLGPGHAVGTQRHDQ